MSDFPTEPSMTNVILQGYMRGCVDEVLKIICMTTNASQIFKRGAVLEKKYKSDFIMFNSLLSEFIQEKNKREFCRVQNLSFKTMNESSKQYFELNKAISLK